MRNGLACKRADAAHRGRREKRSSYPGGHGYRLSERNATIGCPPGSEAASGERAGNVGRAGGAFVGERKSRACRARQTVVAMPGRGNHHRHFPSDRSVQLIRQKLVRTDGAISFFGRSRPVGQEVGGRWDGSSRDPVRCVRDTLGVMMPELHESNAAVHCHEHGSQPGLVCSYCHQSLYLHHCCKYKLWWQTVNSPTRFFFLRLVRVSCSDWYS